MSEVVNKEEQEAATTPEGGEAPKSNKKKIIIIASLLIIAIVAGGAGFWYFKKAKGGGEHDSNDHESSKESENADNLPHYLDLDDFIINLNTGGRGVSFLKLKIKLELERKEDENPIKGYIPKIRDTYQMYLRELRPIDLQGSIGLYRLREELILRTNKIIAPKQVKDILFDEILVQ